MMLSAHARRMVIGVFITLMLLCQTTAAARAPVASVNAAPPCHQDAQNTHSEPPAHDCCQDRCPSRDAAFTPAKIDLPAANTVALPHFALFAVAAANPLTPLAAPHAWIVANAAPPPRLLVYCRLLI